MRVGIVSLSLAIGLSSLFSSFTFAEPPKSCGERLSNTLFSSTEIKQIREDDEMPIFQANLRKLLSKLQKSAARTRSKAEPVIRKFLADDNREIFADSIITAFKNGTPGSLYRIVGRMTLSEVQRLNRSLVRKYLQETGYEASNRRFAKVPNGRRSGPARLAIPVNEKSLKIFKKYFNRPEFLYHLHEPEQGTLMLLHKGLVGSYGELDSTLNLPDIDTMMPQILLSSTEANRASNFFDLVIDEASVREPWTLPMVDPSTLAPGAPVQVLGEQDTYCAIGGYTSCTHWFGNIPVGDKFVDSYAFPGKVDQHAYNNVGRGPQRQILKPHAGSDLAKIVFQAPGHEQLADVIGLQEQNLRGELANPGYVAISLTGIAPVERVPVVFVVVEDDETKIPYNYDPKISAY